jgi:hypothetical protein
MSLAHESPEDIAKGILAGITAVSLITASSACSVIFKCSSSKRDFCMKVSFVRPEEAAESTIVTYTVMTPKQTTTITEAEQTRERQHKMCSDLQAYNDRLTFIPDAIGSCTLTKDAFRKHLIESQYYSMFDTNTQYHIKLIADHANPEGPGIHVLFMDLLQGVRGYNSVTDIQHTPYIVAAVLAVTIVTGVASQDLHSDNVEISVGDDNKVNVLKLIDWDRSICIYDEADRDKIVDWIGSLMDKDILAIPLVCRVFLDDTLNGIIQKIKLNLGQWTVLKPQLITALTSNFTTYYSDLSRRISNIKSSWHSITQEQKRYDIFDLLTFIGFMDCLSKEARNAGTVMQFSPFIYNLFTPINTDEAGLKRKEAETVILPYEMISLEDLVTFRQTYLESLTPAVVSAKESVPDPVTRVKSRLDAIIEILDQFLVQRRPSGSGGRPRYLKRTHRKTIKKQHRNKKNQKSIRRIYRRSKIRKRNTRN